MELSKILNILYRYLWLFVLTITIASLTTFFVLNKQPVSYKATTQLLVGPTLDSPSPDLNALKIGGQLIQTYAELVTTRSYLQSVNDKLDQKMDLETLDNIMSTRQNTETRVLTIIVYHPDPKEAVAIANAAAQTLVELSPSKDNTTALLRNQMSDQSHQVEQIITKAEASIEQLETELTTLKNTKVLAPEAIKSNLEQQNLIVKQLGDERSRLSDALRTLATIYQVLLDTNTNQLQVIQTAEAVIPVDQNLSLRVATSGVSGLVLALIIVFAAEYLDDRVRYPRDLTRAAGVPVLSVIDKHSRLDGSELERIVTFSQPKSEAANNYREVVAKLLFSIGETTPYTFLLSSVGSQSGSDTAATAGNLAVAFAKAGKRVVLIDAQFQNPVLTKTFKADNRDGLADAVITNTAKPHLVSIEQVPNIRFLPIGLTSEKGAEAMLNSTKIAQVVESVQKEADIVLVAGSPVSWFAESLSMASQVNAVVLVARYGEVHSKVFSRVLENLRLMNVQIAGVIFDYNPSPFASNEDGEKISPFARLSSKPATLRNLKLTSKVEESNIAEQTTKS